MGNSFINTKVSNLLEFQGLILVSNHHLDSLLESDEPLEPSEIEWHFISLENVLPLIQSRCSSFLAEDRRMQEQMNSEPIRGGHDNTLLGGSSNDFCNLFDQTIKAINCRQTDGTAIVDGFGNTPIKVFCVLEEVLFTLEEAITNSLGYAYTEFRDKRYGEDIIQVTLDPPCSMFKGQPFPLKPDAAIFLKVLLDKRGDWASVSDFNVAGANDIEPAFRSDRAKKSLPKPLRDLVESKGGKGHRLQIDLLA